MSSRAPRTMPRVPSSVAVRAHHVGQSAHDGDGQPGGLALDQVTGGGQLVGGGDDGRAERIAVRVRAAAQIVQHPHPGRADGDIGEPGAPGPPEGVRDDDADLDAERVPQPVADGPRGGVGVLGQQQHGPGGGVGGVDPGRGHHEPLPVLHDPQRPAARHDPYGLGVDGRLPVRGLDDPALRLGLTIFEVTSSTSPSARPGSAARRSAWRGRRPAAPRAVRAAPRPGSRAHPRQPFVPGRSRLPDTSPLRRPGTPESSPLTRPAPPPPAPAPAGHRGRRVEVGHHQRDGPAADAGGLDLLHRAASTVSTSQPSSSPEP